LEPQLTSIVEKKHYGSQWCQSSNRSSKFLCVNQKKETHTGLQQLEGELMMTEFSFLGGVSLPLKQK